MFRHPEVRAKRASKGDGPGHASFEARLRRAPQRLCSLSSELPLLSVSDHGVEGDEDFAGDGDEGEHFGLTDGE